MSEFFAYLAKNGGVIAKLAAEHLAMVALGLALALAVGVPLGVVSARNAKLGRWIIGAANVIQVFPSLALLAMLMIVFGLGFKSVVVGLFLYSLLPVIRNTCVGLSQVEAGVKEAGTGLGMSRWQMLRRIEFPLSLPFLIAGIRTAAVIAIGVGTIAPLIGGGGLGKEIYAGINFRSEIRIFAGAIPAALLAFAADAAFGWWERRTKAG